VSAGTAFAVAIVLVGGLGGAVQVAVMGELGERIGIVPAVAFSALVVLLISFAALLAVHRSFADVASGLHEPPWLWIGGALSVLIIFGMTVAAPRIGTAATVGLFIAGNLAMAAAIDRFGLFGLERIDLSWQRLAGLALLAVGAALSLYRS
jgi:transporter family-2 protein